MLKKSIIAAIAVTFAAAPVFADGHTAKDRAQSMTGALKAVGKNGGLFGQPGASIASKIGTGAVADVLGQDDALPNGGWGNIGSAITNGVTGTPVSPKNPKGIDLGD